MTHLLSPEGILYWCASICSNDILHVACGQACKNSQCTRRACAHPRDLAIMQGTRTASQQISPLQLPCCCQMLLSDACVKVTNESCEIVCVLTGNSRFPFIDNMCCCRLCTSEQHFEAGGALWLCQLTSCGCIILGPCQRLLHCRLASTVHLRRQAR